MIFEVLQTVGRLVQRVSLTEVVFFPVSRVTGLQIMVSFQLEGKVFEKIY